MKKRLFSQLVLAIALITLLLSAVQPQPAKAGNADWWNCYSKQNGLWTDYATWNCYHYGYIYDQYHSPGSFDNVTVSHSVYTNASAHAGSLNVQWGATLSLGDYLIIWGPSDPNSGVSTNNTLSGTFYGGQIDFLCPNNNPGTSTNRYISATYSPYNSTGPDIGLNVRSYWSWCSLNYYVSGSYGRLMSNGSALVNFYANGAIDMYGQLQFYLGTMDFQYQTLTMHSPADINFNGMTVVKNLAEIINVNSSFALPWNMPTITKVTNRAGATMRAPDSLYNNTLQTIGSIENAGTFIINTSSYGYQIGSITNTGLMNTLYSTGSTYYTISVSGNINNSGGTLNFHHPLIFNGPGNAQAVTNMAGITAYGVTVDKLGGGTVTVDGNISTWASQYPVLVNSGNLNLGAATAMSASGLTVMPGAGLFAGGAWFPTANASLPLVDFRWGCTLGLTGTVAQTIPSSTNCTNLVLENSGAKTLSANLSLAGYLTIQNSAALSLGSKNLTVGGVMTVLSNGVFNAGAGVTTLNGGLTVSGSTFNPGTGTTSFGGGTIASSSALNLNNVVINGTVTGPASGTLNVAGDWANNGTFVPNSSTVAFTGTNQIISGNNTFYNLTKIPGAAAVLTFGAGKTQTVTGKLTLKGGSLTNRLALRSSTAGTQWQIYPTGTFDLDNLDVRDSRNTAAGAIYIPSPAGLNNGNNTNWNFLPTTVTSVSAPAAGMYIAGQNLDFTVKFANPVSVSTSPAPRLALTVGSTTRYADYSSGTGTSSVVFRYTILTGDEDTDGVAVGAIDLNGGTIKDLANFSATLTLTNAASTALVKVDGAPPAVTAVSVPADQTYGLADILDFTVTFSEPVVVTGAPRITLTVGAASKTADYLGGSGTSVLTFRYVVGAADVDSNGIALNSLGLNSGTLKDLNGNPAVLTLNGAASTAGVNVDGTGPAVSSVSAPANGTYKIGAALNVTVHYNRAVTVSGAPYLVLLIGSNYRHAAYLSGSGTSDLVFSYTVREGDLDTDGVSVGGGSGINLNNGLMLDAALGNPANLSLNGNPATPALLVDGVRPATTAAVGPVGGPFTTPNTLDFTVTYNEAVTVSGAPVVNFNLGATAKQAAYYSGSGNTSLVFRYTVQAGDSGAVSSIDSRLALAGGTLRDASGNDALLELNNPSTNDGAVDGSFGGGLGYVVVPGTPALSPVAVALQGNKFIVLGVTNGYGLTLRRLNADGTLDTSFGTGGSTDDGQIGAINGYNGPSSLLVLADGKILVGGAIGSDLTATPWLAGYTADGTLDFSLTDGSSSGFYAALLPDGSGGVIAIGSTVSYYSTVGALSASLATNMDTVYGGSPYPGGFLVFGSTFSSGTIRAYNGSSWVLNISESLNALETFSYAARQSDGKIIALTNQGRIFRYTSAGAPDLINGSAYASISGSSKGLLNANGQLVAAGTYTNLLGAARLTSAGVLDSTFGSSGYAANSALVGAAAVQVIQQADGKLVVLGGGSQATLARFGAAVWVDTTGPQVTSVTLPEAGAYRAGLALSTSIYWDEAVTITGTPRLALTIGAATVQAVYQSWNSTTTRSFFAYSIVSPDTDTDGITVGALTLNGGTIKDAAGNAATLTLPALDGSRILVDTTAPAISAVTRVGATPTLAPAVQFQVTFSEAVSGVSAANFSLTNTGLGGTPAITSFTDGGTVGANDTFIVTVSGYTGSGTLRLDLANNTGVTDLAGTSLATATYTGGEAYTIDTEMPAVSSAAVPADATYTTKTGKDSLVFTLHWSEVVTAAAATPRLALSVGANTRYAPLTAGSGTADWTFTYTAVSDDQDTDGISVVELQANGAALTDTAGNSALLALNSVAATTGVNIQGTFTLTLLSAGGGMGETSTSPSQTSFSDGDSVSLTALPAANSLFVGFSGDVTGTTNPAALLMTSDKTVSAYFELQGAAYVDPSYDSSTPGWGITRFASIQTAVSSAPLGTLINVYPGVSPYTEAVNINRNVNVVLLNNVILNGALSQSAGVLDAPGGTLTLGSSFTSTGGTFNANGGTVKMTGASPAITGTLEFATLEMTGSGTLTAPGATVKTQLTLTSGTFSPADGASFGAVTIASGAVLNAPAGAISVSGDWTNNGTYTANGGTIRLTGASGQVLGGSSPLSFGSLDISSGGVVSTSKALTVSGALNINTGSLDPYTGSSFSSLTVGPSGTFSLSSAGATVTVTGAVNNQGAFSPSNGTLNVNGLFTNSGTYEQTGGTVNAKAGFDNTGTFSQSGGSLAVTGAFSSAGTFAQQGGTLTVSTTFSNSGTFAQSSGTLTVTSGFTNTSAGSYSQTGGTTNTAAFANAGSFAQSGGTLNAAGSFTNTGTYAQSGTGVTTVSGSFDNSEPGSFSASGGTLNLAGNLNHTSTTGSFAATGGTVNFNGSSAQTVSGNVSFANLTLNNPAGVSNTGTLAVSQTLTVSQGTFAPPAGADLADVSIASGAALSAPAGSMSVSGSFANNGTFTANGGTVTFDGTSAQVISGSSAATFANLTVAAGASLSVNAVTPATPAPTVTGILTVNGAFAAPAGTSLHEVSIGAAGTFDAPAGALSISGDLTNAGAFNANGGTVTFNGTAAQTIGGANAVNFNNLTVNNTSSTAAVSYAALTPVPTVSGLLSILDGTFQPPSGTDLNNVSIASGAVLDAPSGGTLSVSGDFANAGAFNANGSTVTLDGSTAQAITGAASFYNLVIANTAAAPAAVSSSAALTVTNTLSINDGIFAPASGSSFKDVAIAAAGALSAPTGNLSVSGDFTNDGAFTPGSGTLIFNGSAAQTIAGASTTNFNNLTVNNTSSTGAVKYAALTPAPAVAGLLSVLDGTFQPPAGADLNNVSTASGAVLDAPAGSLTVSGDFANAGTFNANAGTVTFDGSGAQSITGAATFANLTVDKTAGTLSTADAVNVSGLTTVTRGAFAPASGSIFNGISIAAAGALNAPAGNLSISGDFANNGAFTPGAGTVIFNGSSAQAISGTSAANFNNLTINNTSASGAVSYAAGTPAPAVSGLLAVLDGTFQPPAGTDLNSVSIASGAVLDAPAGSLTVAGSFTNNGAFNANAGTVTFDGAAAQIIGGSTPSTFANLVVNKSAGTLSTTQAVTVSGDTTVTAGTFAPASGSDFSNIAILSGASFTAPSGSLTVSGNFANAGTFTPGTGSVTFDGASAQSISGATSFYDLVIANTAAAPAGVSSSAAITVANTLTVSDGAFAPGDQSSFKDVNIAADGTLDGSAGALSVSGSWTNAGVFTPGSGAVTFNGASGDQVIGGPSATNFNDLSINNSGTGAVKYADGTPAPTVAGLLSVLDGAFALPAGTDLNDVSIASGAVLTAPAGALTVAGDFANSGTFNPNGGTVTFDGTGPQVLSGAATTPFATLIVNKPSGTLAAASPITVSGPATVTSGGFDPFSGSSFNSLAVGQNGSFLMSSPGTVTVTNAVTNAGVFAPSNGTLNAGGGFTNTASGSFEPTGGTLNVTGGFSNAGGYAAAGGTTTVSGNFTNTGSITASAGILDIAGNLANSGSFTASGGTLNLAGNLSSTGTFHPTGGTVVFDGAAGQTVTGNAPTFAGLTLANNSLAGVSIVPPITVTDLLTVASGKFNPPSGSQFTDVRIDAAGTLILDSTDTIQVAGDFTNDGVFTSKNSTVILNGSGDQTIGGSKPVSFRNLEVANTGAASVVNTSAAVTVTGSLTLSDGVFEPFDGSQFANVIIQPDGNFGLVNGAAVTIVNSLVNNGTFAPQGGAVDLWGEFINNGAFSPSGGSVAVGGDFTNNGTYAATGGTLSVVSDFVNASTGHFTSSGGTLNLNGDLFNNGVFNASGSSSVAFTGALPQAILGLNVPAFANLLLDNPAGVTPNLPIDVTGLFDLNQGAFEPVTGSSFTDMRIGAGTALTLGTDTAISASGDITNDGTFNAAAGSVTLDGNAAQVLNGTQPFTFGDLIVDNAGSGAVSSLLPLTVLGDLTVSDGTLLASSGSSFHNVSTAPGAVLDGSAGPITVSGGWNGLGSFVGGSSTVTFNGTPPQAFSGSNVFNNLLIADGAVLEMAANANLGLTGALNLLGSGSLDTSTHQPNTLTLTGTAPQTLPDGLALNSLVIDPGASFTAPADLSVSGNFTNNGVFDPGTGTVTFDGSGSQAVTGSGPTTFNNLVIANTGAGAVTTNPAVIVTGSLAVDDGTFAPAGGSNLNDVTIGANGTLNGSGGTLNVGGDWINNGSFLPGTGTVTFDGSAGQIIGGSQPTTFYNLLADNPAGVVDTTPITVLNNLTVDPNAAFTPADGSAFNNVTIGAGAELIVPPGVDITITGGYTNNGTSDLVTLTLTKAGDGAGTAAYLPAGGAFPKGSVLTLTAVPDANSAFTGWSGSGLSGAASPLEITLDANKTVTATFDVLRFDLAVNIVGGGSGTISANPVPEISTGKYKYGTVVTLTPNPDTGSVFTGWGGALSGWANPATVTITGDTVITANFRPDSQNTAPTFTSAPVETAGKGFIYNYHVATTDSNGDQVALTIVDKPAWLNLVTDGAGNATLQGVPPTPGNYTVTLEVRDALGGVTTQTYTLTVRYEIMFILMYH